MIKHIVIMYLTFSNIWLGISKVFLPFFIIIHVIELSFSCFILIVQWFFVTLFKMLRHNFSTLKTNLIPPNVYNHCKSRILSMVVASCYFFFFIFLLGIGCWCQIFSCLLKSFTAWFWEDLKVAKWCGHEHHAYNNNNFTVAYNDFTV